MSPSYIREIPIIRKPIIHTPTYYHSDNQQSHMEHAPILHTSTYHDSDNQQSHRAYTPTYYDSDNQQSHRAHAPVLQMTGYYNSNNNQQIHRAHALVLHTPTHYDSDNQQSYRTHAPILHTPTYYNSDNQQSHREHAPYASSSHHNTHTNCVVPFHSSTCWRDYFQSSKYSDKLIVIYFTASWCTPCRYMAPIVNEFAAHYTGVAFNKIDVDELFNVAQDYGVQTMPTFMLVKRGKEIDKVTGASREDLQRKIEKHMD
ncbi:hypothetical protein RND81_11G028800 [Saponaria officinalis]|uniref:Thioredoxin domain-containing protein n=1 Tax=Saponaria officinalis TaxID=3572 RepID=A0AAW1HHF6_SAPOF